jgi:primosomal protein N'
MFPPFCYLLKLSVKRASVKSAETAAEDLRSSILRKGYKVLVEGPAPSFHERTQGKYEWQLIVKSKSREQLLIIIEELPANWTHDIDPVDLL